MTEEEKAKKLVDYQKVLHKVREVLEDKKTVDAIMSKYDKQAESKEQYVINRNERIKDLLKVADVDYELINVTLLSLSVAIESQGRP